MSTEFYNRNWRMPKSSNSSKVSNYSMEFDGSGNYIYITSDIDVDYTTGWTVSFWFNISTVGQDSLMGRWDSNWRGAYAASSWTQLRWYDGSNKTFAISAPSVGTWHQAVFTNDNGTLKCYLDGAESSTGSLTSNYDLTINRIGGGTGGWGGIADFDGKMTECCVFDYALSSSQITSLYGNSTDGVGNPMAISGGRKPISYYPIGDYAAFNGSEYLVNNGALSDYNFDITGSGQLIDLGGSNLWSNILVGTNRTGVATVSYWIKGPIPAWNRTYEMGVSGQDLLRSASAQKLYYRFGSGPYRRWNMPTGVDLDASNWLHIVLVFKAGSVTDASGVAAGNGVEDVDLFVNGDLCSEDYLVPGASTSTWGAGGYGIRNYSGATMTERSNAQIWNSELTSSQIETLYNNGSPYIGTQPQPSNLQGWWKLNASATFDGSNWSIPDDSQNSNAGTSSGMTAANLVQSTLNITTPYSRYALDLDGTNDYITTNNVPSQLNTVSLSIWVKRDGNQNSSAGVFGVRNTGVGSGNFGVCWDLAFNTTTNKIEFRVGDTGYNTVIQNSVMTDNTWTHVVGVADGANMFLYINGVKQTDTNTYSTPIETPSNEIFIGAQGSLPTTYEFKGSLSNASVFNIGLSQAQVTELYNSGKPSNLDSFSAYSNLVSWWQLGENSSFDGTNWTVLDEKGTNNGTSVNMTEADLVNGVATSGNGISNSMGGADNIIGDAPYSTANAISYGMGVDAKSTSVPS